VSEVVSAPAVPVVNDEAPSPGKPGKGRLVIACLAGLLLLGGLGAGAFFFMPGLFGRGGQPVEPPPPAVKATVPLGAVVVNLNGQDRRYLRVGVSLGVLDPKHVKELEEHRSQLLDLVISVFSAAEVEKLTSDEGKTAIKDGLVERMREELRLEHVARVYFTEFVIQ
jgi:flagellar FliL protein